MPNLRLQLLMPVLAVLVAFAVGGAAELQRSTATTHADHIEDAGALLTSMLDQETGLRGYLLDGGTTFLAPYISGTAAYASAIEHIRGDLGGDHTGVALVDRADGIATRWHELAEQQIAVLRQVGRRSLTPASALGRKRLMDAFRAANTKLIDHLDAVRDADESRAMWLSTGIGLLAFVLVGGLGTFLVTRRQRQEAAADAADRAYRDGQSEFVETLQAVDDETEANLVLQRHIERWSPGRSVTVFNRNNSENRLEVRAGSDQELRERAATVPPRSCVAIRLGRTYDQTAGETPLLQCELCGKTGEDALCTPLLVSGRVIGSVLVREEGGLQEQGRRRVADSVSAAAPVLGNLRAIAMAETRAHTDALTGLPNRRAVNDTLKRMIAQSHRLERPLAAIAIDLDHFKQVNDRYGHEKGDEALATVSAIMLNTVRQSDFAGRLGGEEFLVLAPDTHPGGALVLAEKLRQAISRVEIPGAGRITASFGVATVPEDAVDADTLLRRADRALYAAKEHGRDRVEAAASASTTPQA